MDPTSHPSRAMGVTLFAMAAAVHFSVSIALADNFRCGRKVVRVGDSEESVLQRCGPPRHKDRGTAEVWLEGQHETRQVRVERWYYKNGERRLERIVLLYQEHVVGIEIGKR